MNEQIEKLLELVQVNEQIERLAKQAGCTIDRMGYGEGNLEMFAELIVKECAKVCHEQALIESEKGSLKSLYKEVALDDIGCKIAKHFGVEE